MHVKLTMFPWALPSWNHHDQDSQPGAMLESPREPFKIYIFLGLVTPRGEVGWEEGEQVDFKKLPMILTGTIFSSPSVSL